MGSIPADGQGHLFPGGGEAITVVPDQGQSPKVIAQPNTPFQGSGVFEPASGLAGTFTPVGLNSSPIPQSMLPMGITNAPASQPKVIAQPNTPFQGSGVAYPNGGAGLNPNSLLGKAFQQAQQQRIISPVSQPQATAQKQSVVRNPNKYNQILAAIQKKKGMKKGGRVGYADGSQPQISQQQIAMAITMLKKGADLDTISSITGIPSQTIQTIISKVQQGIQQKAPGGISGLKTGGIPEIDYRDKGGYVPPIGKKERADDIPAMLSNNEFVFTANAVRNAGGGDVKTGAKKMYALMKQLEKGMA
jgi:hypothetical protein